MTPQVTREVVLHQRLRAARLYLADLGELEAQLAISSKFSSDMLKLADSIKKNVHQREKYRRVISHLRKCLVKTAKDIEAQLEQVYLAKNEPDHIFLRNKIEEVVTAEVQQDMVDLPLITKREDLLGPLRIMYQSLVETGFDLMADGLLSDIIRRLMIFGITLVPLDIREESTKHTEALDSITKWLGVGSYFEWDEDTRITWLASELSNKRPLFATDHLTDLGFDETVFTTLETFKTASELAPEALGAYVISQCQTASDVLAVMLLQKQFGMTASNGNMMRVVPLFETLDDLKNAPEKLETLFSVPAYLGAIKGKQEVMVGCKFWKLGCFASRLY